MANCSECKWRKGGLPKNYICFYQEGISQFKSCSWFEKDETEQKGISMGTCKECQQFDGTYCELLYLGNIDMVLRRRKIPEVDCNDSLMPQEDFGCVHFEQRAKEPFSAHHCCGSPDMWKIILNGDWTDSSSTRFEYKSSAEKLCSWLNEHWRG